MGLAHTNYTNAKPKTKAYKLTDGDGLYMLVKPSGYKSWKYDYRLNGKRGTFTLGKFPDISLKVARAEHLIARESVANGIEPISIKRSKSVEAQREEKRFSYYAKIYLDKQNLASSTYKDMQQRIDKNLTPFLDKKGINEYTTLDLLQILTKVSDRGARETAKRLAGILRKVFNEVLILGLIENNPAASLAELLPKTDPKNKKNFSHLTTPEELKVLLQQLNKPSNRQDYATTQALKFMPLVFLRPRNIRFLKWEYIDFSNKMIKLPASELKTNKPLQVPLAKQAIQILQDMKRLTGTKQYVFTTSHGHYKPMSENTTTRALQRIINPETNKPYGTGYMTSHGFRHTASTLLNELGYDSDAIELQLAHVNQDRIRATYNKAQLIDKRIEMMQGWADYLDSLIKNNKTTIPDKVLK